MSRMRNSTNGNRHNRRSNAMHPIELDALLKLAKTHLRSGRDDQARSLYAKALQADAKSAEALHFLGLSFLHRGRPDKALELVQRSLALAPDKPDYHNNLAT